MTLDDRGCYFRKQPETAAEVDDAIRALMVSCIEVYRYGGIDPETLRRLAEAGYAHLCDHPLEGCRTVSRNRVRFSFPGRVGMGELLISWLGAAWKDGRCTKVIEGDAHRASFEYVAHATYGSPLAYTIEAVGEGVWLVAHDGRHPHFELHNILASNGATAVRWFSHDEWDRAAAGQRLPY